MTARRLLALTVTCAVLLAAACFIGRRGPQEHNGAALTALPAAETQPGESPEGPEARFPDADLRAGLTATCTGDAQDPVDSGEPQDGVAAPAGPAGEWRQSVSRRLSVSSSPEHLVLAALLAPDPASRVALLERATADNETNPLVLWSAVRVCSQSDNAGRCSLEDLEQRLIAVDGGNSESWVRVAANRFARDEHDAALDAMRYASTSAESRAYWPETVEMTERGLAAASDYAFDHRALLAFGLASSNLPRYGDYVAMCRDRSPESAEWAYECLRYGQLVENQGRTEMGIAIAQVIQKLALEALGEVQQAGEVELRIQARRRDRIDAFEDHSAEDEQLIVTTPEFFHSYLAAVRSYGEVAARERIAADIEMLAGQQAELDCE